ncbi:MAG: histidine phosphatase family protein [Planctomycetota bacterium]
MSRTTTTRLILVRHGEVDARWRGTLYGRLDVELSERGLAQSRRIAEVLKDRAIDAVVSSGLARAEAAAAALRRDRPHLERIDDERFLELDRGDWAGRPIEEIRRDDPERYEEWVSRRGAVRAPGGEDPEDVARRTVPAFADWAGRAAGGTVAICAHLWVVRSALAHALAVPMARSSQLGWPPGGLCELDWPADPTSEAVPAVVQLGA